MQIKNPAFIFARGGSKGLKFKNIKMLNNKPLISYTIEFALKSKIFDKIFVSTDDSKIIKICSKYKNVEIIKRPKNLAADSSPELLSWKHSLKYLNKKKFFFDKMIILPVTSPFKLKTDIDLALSALDKNTDIVLSITHSNKNPQFNMLKKNGKYYEIFSKPKKNIFRRQDADEVYDITTLFYIIKTNYLKKTKKLLDGNIKGIVIPKIRSIDIDDKIDFEFASFLMKKNIWKY